MRPALFWAAVAAAMLAFAANSILNRAAVAAGEIDAVAFAVWRVGTGAALLATLTLARGRGLALLRRGRVVGAAALSAYILGFSAAYLRLDAGLGALILFGGVQLTMFAGGLLGGDAVPARRWAGAALALAGLAVLVWPGSGAAAPIAGVAAMAAAAVGWGVYSLAARGVTDPLAVTAANFVWAVPVCVLAALLANVWGPEPGRWADFGTSLGAGATAYGKVLAAVSGAVTSGLGYAIWYAVVPGLGAARAGLVQLSVPVIAIALGAVLLSEVVAPVVWVAAALVIGGIALGLWPQRRIGSSGS